MISKVEAAELMALRRTMRRVLKLHGGKVPKTCELPELERLDLPTVLPGETPPQRVGRDEVSQDWGLWYGPYGLPLTGTLEEQMAAHLRYRAENMWASRTFYRAGVRIGVSTVFLGLDHNWSPEPGGLPLIWETMVFTGGLGSAGQWRYATRAAAQFGHAVVVQRLALAQRLRRASQALTAPRHGWSTAFRHMDAAVLTERTALWSR